MENQIYFPKLYYKTINYENIRFNALNHKYSIIKTITLHIFIKSNLRLRLLHIKQKLPVTTDQKINTQKIIMAQNKPISKLETLPT